MDFAAFDTPRPDVDTDMATRIAASVYGLNGSATALAGERDRSFKIETGSGVFALKVGNASDRPDALESQAQAMAHALYADPDLPVPAVVPTREGTPTGMFAGHSVQLVAFIDGRRPPSEPSPPGLRRSVGALAGRLSRALRGFDHPALHRAFPWDLGQLTDLAPLVPEVEEDVRPLIEGVLARMQGTILPITARLGRQAVHGDINPDNIVVDGADPESITGLFDFGDMTWGPRIHELAVAATYQCFDAEPALAIAQVAAAFHVVDPLEAREIDILPDLVGARAAQSILMASRSARRHNENVAYLTGDRAQMVDVLRRLADIDGEHVIARVRDACGFGRRERSTFDEVLATRLKRLGPSLSLSYDEPVRLESGEGVWLVEEGGRRLLDAYNNVPHVGHAHPEVVSAVAAQVGRLSTNTRYLVDEVVDYADRLAGLLPDPLDVVMFVNSGSEANDLAYQIASSVTGRSGVITTDNAYHGTTFATTAMSPEEFPEPRECPPTGRAGGAGVLRARDAAERVADQLADASRRLESDGSRAAMAIFDTVFSSEGIFEMPAGFLESARTWADDHGALLVADEVQAGFGRVGPQMWGFRSDTAVPDIVTVGKPMANGYPMGAVITTAEIAERFAARWHFFSTFGGSPVATAAANAVLNVMESEELAANAALVGDHLRAGIRSLHHGDIVDVRGPGLFVGVEMIDGTVAARVVNDLRGRGALIGTSGRGGNVLKIRPPLVFTTAHADLLMDMLAESLTAGIAGPI